MPNKKVRVRRSPSSGRIKKSEDFRPKKKVRVRTYRHGLGDCHLVSFLKPDGRYFHTLIDCGVVDLTPNAEQVMTGVAKDIANETKDPQTQEPILDLVIATHQHTDHLSGFVQAKSEFDQIKMKRLWLAWTEDKVKGQKVKQELGRALAAARQGLAKLAAANSDAAPRVKGVLDFFGSLAVDGARTQAMLDYLVAKPGIEIQYHVPGTVLKLPDVPNVRVYVLGPTEDVSQWRITNPRKSKHEGYEDTSVAGDAEGFVSALGPAPEADERSFPFAEVYRKKEDYAGEHEFFRSYYGLGKGERDACTFSVCDFRDLPAFTTRIKQRMRPVDVWLAGQLSADTLPALGMSQGSASDPPARLVELMQALDVLVLGPSIYEAQRFAGVNLRPETQMLLSQNPQGSELARLNRMLIEDACDPDLLKLGEQWRRIDTSWLESSENLAIALNDLTNNTSLALAFEFIDNGEVLLFPGDAQIGSWLSWQKLVWTVPNATGGTKKVRIGDLLANTVFYKASHHASHNGTLSEFGLEKMKHRDLVIFVPVDRAMSKQKHWDRTLPWQPLLDKLAEKSRGRLILTDASEAAPVAANLINLDPLERARFAEQVVVTAQWADYSF